ncbi:hypothetical protein LEMLEM_LOCUS27682 [Lemmus lemmus]
MWNQREAMERQRRKTLAASRNLAESNCWAGSPVPEMEARAWRHESFPSSG